jgi:hypothetical protein
LPAILENHNEKALVWTTTRSLELYFIFLWLFNDIQWAGNLVKFWVSFATIILFLSLCIPEASAATYKKGRSVPKVVAYIANIVAIALLASQGQFWFASLYALSAMFELTIFESPPKE